MRYLIFVIIFLAILMVVGCGAEGNNQIEDTAEALTGLNKVGVKQAASQDLAIARCREIFQQKVARGEDMNTGPCLAEEIVEGWACDVAHNPREDIDNDPANQCQSFRDGQVTHFVELDQSGVLIKAQ